MNIFGVTHASNFHADEAFATALIKFWCDKHNFKFDYKRVEDLEEFYANDLDRLSLADYDHLFIYDTGKKHYLNDFDHEYYFEVSWLDHHQDPKLPCAAVLVLDLLLQHNAIIAKEEPLVSAMFSNSQAFLESLRPKLMVLSDWDAKGVPLPTDSVFNFVNAFRFPTLMTKNEMDKRFHNLVDAFYQVISLWKTSFRLENKLIENTALLIINSFGDTVYKWTLNETFYFTRWQDKVDIYVCIDRRNPANLSVQRSEELKDKINFYKMHQFKPFADFTHANGFMMTFKKDDLADVLVTIQQILKHF
jgi:hypothetical protein